jgi:LuxR family maltose regulon positive regulatory protein
LADLYRLTQAALTVEPGLDTNTLVDRVTGRRDPRHDPDGWAREFDWSTRNPDDYLVEFGHRAQGLGVAAEHPGRNLAEPDRAVPSQPLVDPLSMRELQVLKLLDSELSAPEVARALFVSHNTVRTHTRHIFAKLQVTTRRAAVLRAHECGLL